MFYLTFIKLCAAFSHKLKTSDSFLAETICVYYATNGCAKIVFY
jgi:hypothetical protein